MIARRIPGTAKREVGTMVIDCNHPEPFKAENDFEEAFLHYMSKISNAVEDLEAATSGEIDNCVEVRLYSLEAMLSVKLDAVIEELRLMRQGRAI